MGQIPGVPGPKEDPHFIPTGRFNTVGQHFQADPVTAAEMGWYYRPAWYLPLIPDTRRCRFGGEQITQDDWPGMTDEDRALRDPSSPNIMAGPTFQWP
jgi:hypothetical protein